MPIMNPYDKVLEAKGLTYDKLTSEEKELYQKAATGINAISVEELHERISELLVSVAMELCDVADTPEQQDNNKRLKASLKMYVLMDAMLSSPYKLAKALEKQLELA